MLSQPLVFLDKHLMLMLIKGRNVTYNMGDIQLISLPRVMILTTIVLHGLIIRRWCMADHALVRLVPLKT
jgi:hypothetical protein